MTPAETPKKPFQIDALDGLRGFAALLVVFSHTSNVGMHLVPFLDFSGTGKSGVYLFFLLSSFLLSIPLLSKGSALFSPPVMGNYWMRRFLRIYPLYTCYLLAALCSTLVLTRFFNTPNTGVPYSLYPEEFLRNLLLFNTKGVTWSIAVEFKFYFILPVLAYLTTWVGRAGMLATTCFLLALIVAGSIVWPTSEWENNDVRLRYYLPVFLAGILMAVIHRHLLAEGKGHAMIRKSIVLASPIAVAALLVMVPSVHSLLTGSKTDYSAFHRDFLAHTAAWSVVMMAAAHGRGLLASFFNLRFMRFCGALSFSIYLFHMPLISIMKRTSIHPTLCGWVVMIVSVFAAYLSYRFLERPLAGIRWPLKRVASQAS